MESQLRLTVVLRFGIPYISYQNLFCLLHVCTSLTLSGIYILVGLLSELFGVSAQTDSGIRIWHSLYILPEFIVPTSCVHLSDTFRYFYFWLGVGLNSLKSEVRLTVVLGFDIPFIPYQTLWCLLLVCTSLTLSGISTLRQDWV